MLGEPAGVRMSSVQQSGPNTRSGTAAAAALQLVGSIIARPTPEQSPIPGRFKPRRFNPKPTPLTGGNAEGSYLLLRVRYAKEGASPVTTEITLSTADSSLFSTTSSFATIWREMPQASSPAKTVSISTCVQPEVE